MSACQWRWTNWPLCAIAAAFLVCSIVTLLHAIVLDGTPHGAATGMSPPGPSPPATRSFVAAEALPVALADVTAVESALHRALCESAAVGIGRESVRCPSSCDKHYRDGVELGAGHKESH